MAKTRARPSGYSRMLLGFVLGVLAAGAAGFAYFKFAGLTVTAVDKQLPSSKRLVGPPPNPHLDREKKLPPFGASEDAFESGAHIYRTHCASCHGTPGHDATPAKSKDPAAQLWKNQGQGVAEGKTHDPSEIYWKVANGIRLTGMPAYKQVLSETQLWQVSLLLANAHKELPRPVNQILSEP